MWLAGTWDSFSIQKERGLKLSSGFLALSPVRATTIKNCYTMSYNGKAAQRWVVGLFLVLWLLSLSAFHPLITADTEPRSTSLMNIVINIDFQALIIPNPVLLEFEDPVVCSQAGFGKGVSRETAASVQFPV